MMGPGGALGHAIPARPEGSWPAGTAGRPEHMLGCIVIFMALTSDTSRLGAPAIPGQGVRERAGEVRGFGGGWPRNWSAGVEAVPIFFTLPPG